MKEKGRLLFFILPSVAIVLFILLVFVGALSYEGGNRLDHNSIGYSFSNNYLSDLGRIKTVAGHNNSIPFYCFNSSLIILSVVFSFYFLFFLLIVYSTLNDEFFIRSKIVVTKPALCFWLCI